MSGAGGDDAARRREDALHIGATRPAMFLGLPMKMTLCLFGVGYIVAVNVPGWQGLAWAAALLGPAYVAARLAVRRSIFGIEVVFGWLRTSGVTFDRATWGGSSRSPLPARQAARARGMRHV